MLRLCYAGAGGFGPGARGRPLALDLPQIDPKPRSHVDVDLAPTVAATAASAPLDDRVSTGEEGVRGSVGPELWDGPMTLPPTDTRPGTDACPGPGVDWGADGSRGAESWADLPADGWPDADALVGEPADGWLEADGMPTAAQLAVWFAHPSAVLDDADRAPKSFASAPRDGRVSAGEGGVLDSVGPCLWDGPMTFPPTDTRPGDDACPGADACAQPGVDSPASRWPGDDVWTYADGWPGDGNWVEADVVPSAGQLAVWFAHPSAVLDDAWAPCV